MLAIGRIGGKLMESDDKSQRWAALAKAIHLMLMSRSIEEGVETVRAAGREIVGADGVAIVRRYGNESAYVAEDCIAPLWAGQRFPLESCAAGMAILDNAPMLVPDISRAPRIPLNLYIATFVRRMAIYPIGVAEPIGAICAYWREEGEIDEDTNAILTALARSMGSTFDALFALENARVRAGMLTNRAA